MPDATQPGPRPGDDLSRTPDDRGERRGRGGPDVGDTDGGEGAEFLGDATAAEGEVDREDADAWFAAHGTDPDQR